MTDVTQVPAADTTQGGVQAEGADGAKPNGEGAPANQPAQTDSPAAAEVKYEFKMPEGVEADEKAIADFTKVAKELKLTPEHAQKLVDLRSAAVKAAKEQHAAEVAGWEKQVREDKELGGDKFDENLATARKAIDLGPPELKELLTESGLGSHPAVFRWALNIGKALSEDTFKSGAAVPAPKTAAELLYGNTPAR